MILNVIQCFNCHAIIAMHTTQYTAHQLVNYNFYLVRL